MQRSEYSRASDALKRLTAFFLALLVGAGLVVSAWLLSNAFDADLSPDARRIVELNVASDAPADESNAYFWLTALGAPDAADPAAFARARLKAIVAGPPVASLDSRFGLDDKTVACRPEHFDCLRADADTLARLMKFIEGEAWRAQLIERMRAAPHFVEIHGVMGPEFVPGDAGHLLKAQAFTFARVRLAAAVQEWEITVSELEEDMAFQRRALAGVRTLVPKLIAAQAVLRNAKLAAALWHSHGAALEPQRDRLRNLAAPLPEADPSLVFAGELDRGAFIGLLAREGRDSFSELNAGKNPTLRSRLERLVFLPNQTANELAAQFAAQRAALNGVTRDFDAARHASQSALPSEAPAHWWQRFAIRNSVGHHMSTESSFDITPYQAALHDLQATLTLTRALLTLPPAPSREDWQAVLRSPEFSDPYTGAPLIVDEKLGQPAIAARRTEAQWAQPMFKATGGKLVALLP